MPNWSIDLLIGLLSSLLASALIIGMAGLVSKSFRWILTGMLGRLLEIDVEFVFTSPREAASEVKRELARSNQILLMTGRGSELQRETFTPLFASLSASTAHCLHILLPDTHPPSHHVDWVARREAETASFDSSSGNGLLRQQINTTTKFLEGFTGRGNLEVRYHHLPLIGRILITDNCAFLTPYSKHSHSRESKVIKYRRGGDMYDFLKRIFDESWAVSRPALE